MCWLAASLMLTFSSPWRMQRELEKPSKNPCEPPKSATTSLPGIPVTETAVSVPEQRGERRVAGGVQLLELQRLLPQVEQVQIVEKVRAAALAAEEQDLVAVLR